MGLRREAKGFAVRLTYQPYFLSEGTVFSLTINWRTVLYPGFSAQQTSSTHTKFHCSSLLLWYRGNLNITWHESMKAAVDMLCNSSMLRQDQGSAYPQSRIVGSQGRCRLQRQWLLTTGKIVPRTRCFPGRDLAALQNKDTSLTPRYGDHFDGSNRQVPFVFGHLEK
jgi:hypothetical protein